MYISEESQAFLKNKYKFKIMAKAKKKPEENKLNMTYEEAMKKALNTPLPKKIKQLKKTK